MSLGLIVLTDKVAYMGADTALSFKENNKHKRHSDNCKKIFELDNNLMFLSGNLQEVSRVITEILDIGKIDIYQLFETIKQATKKIDCFLISYNESIVGYQLSPYLDDIKIFKPSKGEINILGVGVMVKESTALLSDIFNKNNNIQLAKEYEKIFNTLCDERVGGRLILKSISKRGIKEVLNCEINDKHIERYFKQEDLELVTAEQLVGQIILG